MFPDALPPTNDAQPAGTAEGEAATIEAATDPTSVPVQPAGPARPARRLSGGGLVLAVAIVLVAILGGGGLFASGYALGQHQASQPGTPATDATAFQPFWDVYHAVRDRYALGPVADKTIVEGAIKGMMEAVGDPYSTYMTSEEFRASLQGINGEFEGIGAEIGTVDASGKTVDCPKFGPDCRLVIVAPIDGSPAAAADLRPGDVIADVDGSSVDGLTLAEARARIVGKKGTNVVLRIERKGVAAFDVTITRDVIHQREVITRDLAAGSIGYIRLTGFSDNAAKDFVAAVKADLAKGETRLIVDLRGNPGGLVTAARTVASTFVKDGPVFWEQDAQGNQTATQALPDGVATDPKIQVAVLIDKGSASASEIVAGALQDTKRATLIGETSYGKGTVQTWIELDNDTGAVKLTVAKWLTPNKRWIHKVGLTPDIPVTVPASTPAGTDPVLDKAVEFLGGLSLVPAALLRAA